MDKQRIGERWGVTLTLRPSRILCLSTDASCEVCSLAWRYLTTWSLAAKGLFFKLVPLFSLQYAKRADTCFPKIILFCRIDLGLRKGAYQKGRLIGEREVSCGAVGLLLLGPDIRYKRGQHGLSLTYPVDRCNATEAKYRHGDSQESTFPFLSP